MKDLDPRLLPVLGLADASLHDPEAAAVAYRMAAYALRL